MNFCNLHFVFLATFYFVIRVKADWSEDRGLIVNQLFGGGFPYEFPKDVRYSHHNDKIVFVESGDTTTKTYYLCPHHPEYGNIDESCLFRYELEEDETEPRCNGHKVEPYLLISEDQCGTHENAGHFYEVSYKICKYSYSRRRDELKLKSVKWLNVYDLCYSNRYENQLYSYFAIPATAVLQNDNLSNEAGIMTTYQDDNPTIWNECQFNLQPVLPPRLMAFAVARRPFLDVYNLAYMRYVLMEPWDIVIVRIISKLKDAGRPVKVYAGTYGALTHVNRRIIPQIWWITIYDWRLRKGTTVILPNGYYQDIETIQCENHNIIRCSDVNLEVTAGIYCCKANFIAVLTGIPIRVSENFEF